MTRIRHCGRTVAGDVVAFDIQWEGTFPESGSVAWSMVLTGPDGTETVRLVHERGAPEAQYVEGAIGRQDVDVDADVDTDPDGGEITVRFPANVVGVAVEWPVWTAVLSVDGRDVASCVVPVG